LKVETSPWKTTANALRRVSEDKRYKDVVEKSMMASVGVLSGVRVLAVKIG
jgi:hypothetical protein